MLHYVWQIVTTRSDLKCVKKSLAARLALPGPAGELTALPRSPTWISGGRFASRKNREVRAWIEQKCGRTDHLLPPIPGSATASSNSWHKTTQL